MAEPVDLSMETNGRRGTVVIGVNVSERAAIYAAHRVSTLPER